MTSRSPFFVVDELISPLNCEDVIQRLNNKLPDHDKEGNILHMVRANKLSEIRLLPAIDNLVPHIESHYGFTLKGISEMQFEWYPTGFKTIPARCENSTLARNKKWLRANNKDFVGVLFLNDYQDTPPFDDQYEVMGGKLAFPNHNFSFKPVRGQFVVFPGSQHFIHATEKVSHGELNQMKVFFTATDDYLYNPKDFPGNYTTWFT